jgi:hypothetical protein
MARDPAEADRLAQALRANLRRRKAAPAPAQAPQDAEPGRDASPRELSENKPQT